MADTDRKLRQGPGVACAENAIDTCGRRRTLCRHLSTFSQLLFAVTAATFAGCATVAPLQERLETGADIERITPAERRLWGEAKEFDRALRNSEQVYEEEAVTRYLQGVMDRLYPEFQGKIGVKIVKSPHLNAFALPNGSIYFHVGLLARLDNEAQLATVLAHEGAHFVHKHSFKQRETIKGSAVFATMTAAIGIPIIGDVIALSSIYGYSRDLEREADLMGYDRLIKSGYDPRESHRAFEHLAAEAKALDSKEPFFFASHPKLQQRIESFKELSAKHTGAGVVGKEPYLAMTRKARLAALEGDISMNRYRSVLVALGTGAGLENYPVEALYYLGEAYRQRGDNGDDRLAEQTYIKAVKAAPTFAPSYRALGVHYMKQRNYSASEKYLAKYLQLTPNAPDREYVAQYYQNVKRELAKQ